MTNRIQDTLLGIVLLLIAGLWSWLVIMTIPAGTDGVGPRAFPLAFGVMLVVLAGLLLLKALATPEEPETDEVQENGGLTDTGRWLSLVLVVVEIVAYAMLLKYCGFVIATPVFVVTVMLVNLREFRLKRLILTPAAITLACWLIFEKILGIYLANGIWINIG